MNAIKYIKNISLPQKVLYLMMALFGGLYFTIVIANHYYFRTYAFDYAVYNFAFWDYAHFHMNIVPCNLVYGNTHMTFLQDHFSLTLMYLMPLYWLLNWLTGTYTLLVILVLFILWSAWALYRLIKLKTNDEWLAVIAVLYYFLLQGRYSSFTADSNIFTLICCFVPIFLLCFELKKYVLSFIIFLLLLFSREDIPLWFSFIFIVLMIWHRKEKKVLIYCAGGIVLCVIYFILLFKVFIPMCETPEKPYNLFKYAALGNTPWEAFHHIIRHPLEAIKLLYTNQSGDSTFDGVKKEFYMVYLISGGFVLFYRPQYFIWFIPLIAQKMFNDDQVRWGITMYYSIPVVTLLPVSVFLILSKFKLNWIRYPLGLLVCALTLHVTLKKMDVNNLSVIWGSTLKENVGDPRFFNPGYDAAKVHEYLKLIPENAKICASESILPHLSQRKYAYEFPDIEDADYLAVFTFRNFYLLDEDAYANELYKYIFSPSWKVIAYMPSFILWKKMPVPVNEGSGIDSVECVADSACPDKMHFKGSNGELFGNAYTREGVVKFRGNNSIKLNKKNPYGFSYSPANYRKGDYIKVTVWKYSAGKNLGALVVTCGKSFYKSASKGNTEAKSGWEQLKVYVKVPEDNSDFRIYALNESADDVWFDDIKIVRHSFK